MKPPLPHGLPFALLLSAAAAQALPATDPAAWNCVGQCLWMPAQGDVTPSPAGQPGYGVVRTAGSTAYGVSPLQLDPNGRGLGTETNGSRWTSPAFALTAGTRLLVHFNYASTDGKGFDDYAWARLVDAQSGQGVAWLFTARSSNSGTRNIVPGDVVSREAFDPRVTLINYEQYDFNTRDGDHPIDWVALGESNGSCWRQNAAGCGFTGWLSAEWTSVLSGQYRLEVGIVNWGDEAFDSALAFDFPGFATSIPEPAAAWLTVAGLVTLLTLRRRR